MANAKFLGADLSIAIGTSLSVQPAASLPFKSKRRKKNLLRPRAVVVNVQPTQLDSEADAAITAPSHDTPYPICKLNERRKLRLIAFTHANVYCTVSCYQVCMPSAAAAAATNTRDDGMKVKRWRCK